MNTAGWFLPRPLRGAPAIAIMALSAGLFPATSHGGEAVGKVASILLANNSNAVLFRLDNEIEGSPRCNKLDRFAIDLRQPGGGALYAALLEAKSHGYTVIVTGLNTCGVQLESEGVKNIEFQ